MHFYEADIGFKDGTRGTRLYGEPNSAFHHFEEHEKRLDNEEYVDFLVSYLFKIRDDVEEVYSIKEFKRC